MKTTYLLLSVLLGWFATQARAQLSTVENLEIAVTASEVGISTADSGLDPTVVEALRQYLGRRLQNSSFMAHGGQMRFHITGHLLLRLEEELASVDLGNPAQVDEAMDRVLRDYQELPWTNLEQTQFIIGRPLAAPVFESVPQLVVIGSDGEIHGDVERAIIIGSRIHFKNDSHVRQALIAIGSQVTADAETLSGAQRVDVVFPAESGAWFQSLGDGLRQEWQRDVAWLSWPASFYGGLISFLLSLAFGGLYLTLFPLFHKQAITLLSEQKVKTLGIGVLGYAGLIFGLTLLAITVIGILLMPSLLFFFAVFNGMGYFTAASAIGQKLLHRYRSHAIWAFSLGVLSLQIVGLIPWLGWMIVQVIAMAGFGAVLLALFQRLQQKPSKQMGRAEIWPRPIAHVKRWKTRSGI